MSTESDQLQRPLPRPCAGEQPSAIDLVWTPLVGGLLGEARFRLHRWFQARGSSLGAALVDPLGTLERWAGSGC